MKKRITRYFLKFVGVNLLFFLTLPVFALPLKITLESLQVIVKQEKHGDELYLDIMVSPSSKPTQFIRLPKKPHYWPSKVLPRIKAVPLWQGDVVNGQAINLTISLIEQDVAPWNTDDLIGSVKVQVSNENNKLKVAISKPEQKTKTILRSLYKGLKQKVSIQHESSHYIIELGVEENKVLSS